MTQAATRWHGMEGPRELAHDACARILSAAGEAVTTRGRFDIVLAGGNTPRRSYELLCAAPAHWEAWHVWFGDERCLPVGDAERNSRMARQTWLNHVPIPDANIHAMPAELGAIEAARQYAASLAGVGDFDLVLLGLGEDGHTASLFPGHDWGRGANASDTLAVFNSPKPPPERVSLSAARLARARRVLYLVEGEGKREAVACWRAGADLPAASITPVGGIDVLIDHSLLTPAT